MTLTERCLSLHLSENNRFTRVRHLKGIPQISAVSSYRLLSLHGCLSNYCRCNLSSMPEVKKSALLWGPKPSQIVTSLDYTVCQWRVPGIVIKLSWDFWLKTNWPELLCLFQNFATQGVAVLFDKYFHRQNLNLSQCEKDVGYCKCG